MNRRAEVWVLLFGPRPLRQVTGVTLAFELVCDYFRKNGSAYEVVDFLKYSGGTKVGRLNFRHLLGTIVVLMIYTVKLPRCDIVYATMSTSRLGFFRDFFITQLGKLFGKKVIFHLHGGGFASFFDSQPGWLRKLILFNHNRIDKIIVLGELLRDQFSQLQNYREKTYVVPNGLTFGISEPKPRIKEAPNAGESVRLLYLSNMIKSKGYLKVLDACSILKKKNILFECRFCGVFLSTSTNNDLQEEDEQKNDFLKRVERLSVKGAEVIFDGKVEGKRKERVLAKAHIFILPTTYPWEGQPLSIIEAMAHGTPVISTQHKGIPEQVIDSKNGWLIDPDDPASIAEAIVKTISDPNIYAAMSVAARQRYEQHFRREVHLERLKTVLFDCNDEHTTI